MAAAAPRDRSTLRGVPEKYSITAKMNTITSREPISPEARMMRLGMPTMTISWRNCFMLLMGRS